MNQDAIINHGTIAAITARCAIVFALLAWLALSPIVLAASGPTLSNLADGPRVGVVVLAFALACVCALVLLGFFRRKSWAWLVATLVAAGPVLLFAIRG